MLRPKNVDPVAAAECDIKPTHNRKLPYRKLPPIIVHVVDGRPIACGRQTPELVQVLCLFGLEAGHRRPAAVAAARRPPGVEKSRSHAVLRVACARAARSEKAFHIFR